MKTFKVGNKVRAITNDYDFTSIANQWEGIVTYVRDDGTFDAATTNSDQFIHGVVFDELQSGDFELIEQEANVIRINGREEAYNVGGTLLRSGYWVKVVPHGEDYSRVYSVYIKESEE